VKISYTSTLKISKLNFVLLPVCIIFAKSEDKLHLSIKNKQAYFVLLSVCIIFAKIIKTTYA